VLQAARGVAVPRAPVLSKLQRNVTCAAGKDAGAGKFRSSCGPCLVVPSLPRPQLLNCAVFLQMAASSRWTSTVTSVSWPTLTLARCVLLQLLLYMCCLAAAVVEEAVGMLSLTACVQLYQQHLSHIYECGQRVVALGVPCIPACIWGTQPQDTQCYSCLHQACCAVPGSNGQQLMYSASSCTSCASIRLCSWHMLSVHGKRGSRGCYASSRCLVSASIAQCCTVCVANPYLHGSVQPPAHCCVAAAAAAAAAK
jgi:hypothetical protein